jgi:hypothetical protein
LVSRIALGQQLFRKAMDGADAFNDSGRTGDIALSLERAIFHELAHAITSRAEFGGDKTLYAGVEALAIAAENLIYAKDRHEASRVGHGGVPTPATVSVTFQSFDPAAPFVHVPLVSYKLDTKQGSVGLFYGADTDGGTIYKGYNASSAILNYVTVGGVKNGLVSGTGDVSQTFTDAMSGMLAAPKHVTDSLHYVASALVQIDGAFARLAMQSTGSVKDLLTAKAAINLADVTSVVGNSNERFVDGPEVNGVKHLVNYVGPVNPDGKPHIELTAGVPSILVGASGFEDAGKKIHLAGTTGKLHAADGGTNVLIGGSGHSTGDANVLEDGTGNDVLVGGKAIDDIHADQGYDLVVQSDGYDNVFGNGKTIFVANQRGCFYGT